MNCSVTKVTVEYSVKYAQIRKERLQMKKKAKGIVGLCLVAALAVGGVGTYAQAQIVPIHVRGDDGVLYTAYGESTIVEASGTAHTAESGSAKCHCTVSATFRWYGSNGNVIFSNGNSAGGLHYASVTIGNISQGAVAASAVADHTVHVTVGGHESAGSAETWVK